MTRPPASPRTKASEGSRERTLARILDDVRALLPVEAVSFVAVDEERGVIEATAGWFASPELRDALGPGDEHVVGGTRQGLVAAALRAEGPLLVPRIEAWEAAPDLPAERAWRRCGAASVIACPVRADDGHAFGVLVVASLAKGRSLGPAHARTLEAAADLAAMALDRAGLLEAQARRVELGRASEAVSASLELEEVYASIARQATDLTGASRALLIRINSRTGELRTEARLDFSDEQVDRLLVLSADSFGQVARTRAPLLRRSAGVKGQGRRLLEAEGIGTLMHVPIELGPRLFGVLTVAHEEPSRFEEQDLELLVQLARTSAGAIANAIDFQRERRIARALTLGFVPESLPRVPGYETGLLYAPAENEPTGGDVYGAWPVGEGEAMAVLIGDVAGKGVETAALSSMVRFFVEARCWDSQSPSLVLEQANRMLHGRLPPDSFVTAFFGILSAGSLRYSNAGHLPPLLVRSGQAVLLEAHGLPLGVAEAGAFDEAVLTLDEGDLVFAYTDGLVEARRSGELYGIERLTRLVTGWSGTLGPGELVGAVHEEVASWAGGLADDAVALALRRSP